MKPKHQSCVTAQAKDLLPNQIFIVRFTLPIIAALFLFFQCPMFLSWISFFHEKVLAICRSSLKSLMLRKLCSAEAINKFKVF